MRYCKKCGKIDSLNDNLLWGDIYAKFFDD